MQQSRRKFLIGLTSTLVTAPAIVRPGLLMPIKPIADIFTLDDYYNPLVEMYFKEWQKRVADSIMNGSDRGGLAGVLIRSQMNDTLRTKGETSLIYPYEPLEAKPVWLGDLYDIKHKG